MLLHPDRDRMSWFTMTNPSRRCLDFGTLNHVPCTVPSLGSDLLCATEDPSCAIDLADHCSIFVFPSLVACLGWCFGIFG